MKESDSKPALDDEAAERAFQSLGQKRQEWESLLVVSYSDFALHIRGGAWAMAQCGKAAGSVRAGCRGQSAKDFCALPGLTKSATFYCSRYGEAAAGVLARKWCRKMQFYYDMRDVASKSGMKPGWNDVHLQEHRSPE